MEEEEGGCLAIPVRLVERSKEIDFDFNRGTLLLAGKTSGRQIAREPLEDELWPWRALLAASASRCSSWCSAASARGSR